MTIALSSTPSMTSVRTIISDALREGGILALGETPTDDMLTEGVRLLNRIMVSLLGNELGDNFTNLSFGAEGIENTFGKSENRQDFITSTYVPSNTRLLCNIDSATTVYLNPNPMDGCRFAVIDNADNFSVNNFTIDGNGRKIEGHDSVTLITSGSNEEWFYRADLGEWRRVSNLNYDDILPFPQQFDDFFSLMLAMRLDPRYGQSMAPETSQMLTRARSQFRAKYRQVMEMHSELGIIRLPSKKKYFNYTVPMYRFYRGY